MHVSRRCRRTNLYGWLAQELLSFQYNSDRLERGAENCVLTPQTGIGKVLSTRVAKRTLWMQLNSRSLLERAALTNASCFESSSYILNEIKSQAACAGTDTLAQLRICCHSA